MRALSGTLRALPTCQALGHAAGPRAWHVHRQSPASRRDQMMSFDLYYGIVAKDLSAGGSIPARSELLSAHALHSSPERGPGTVEQSDYSKFVRYLHLASPYVIGHRSRTFVIVIPGEVIQYEDRLQCILEDILLLHGLGVRVVLVVGSKELIDKELEDQQLVKNGLSGKTVGGHRVSDPATMQVVIAKTGAVVNQVSAMLSKGPPIPMMRRHAKGSNSGTPGSMRFSPSVQVVSGNYVNSKRRGIVNGIDFGASGVVSHLNSDAMLSQLRDGNLVLLTCMGISSAGELLNCSVYDVGVQASLALNADKLICFTGKQVRDLNLPHYLPLEEAKLQIGSSTLGACSSMTAWSKYSEPLADRTLIDEAERLLGNKSGDGVALDLDPWVARGVPLEILSAITACHYGVSRSHLVDFEEDGAMLLELYSRDGISGVCMIASDIYQGIRPARLEDASYISKLLDMLQEEGYRLSFSPEKAIDKIESTTVLERDGDILACVVFEILGHTHDDLLVAEIQALYVSPLHRRIGLGDSLLDFVEQDLRRKGVRRVIILAGEGSFDWFVDRGFSLQTPGTQEVIIPNDKKSSVLNFANIYSKPILELDASLDVPAGKRIGF